MTAYAPAWPVLEPSCLLRRPAAEGELPFPLSANSKAIFHAARYAIYQLFRALALREDEPVLVPAYHHGNEVRALRAAGARVRFYGVDRALAPDLDGIERLAREGARVLYVIHYLGWPQPLEELLGMCRRHGLLLFEDCALAFLSEPDGRPLGSHGDYAVFCLYKTVAVPNGSALVGRDGLCGVDSLRLAGPGALTGAGRAAELMLQGLRGRADALGRPLLALKKVAGRALSAVGAARIPIGDDGFDPSAASVGASGLTRWLLPRFDYAGFRARRRENFLRLRDRLAGGVPLLFEDLPAGVCPLFFPILVQDKARAAAHLRRRGIEAIEVWNEGDPEAQGFPDVRFLRRHVLELPVHQGLSPRQVEHAAEEVLSLGLCLPEGRWPARVGASA